jgi:hypothetical protein
VNRLDDIRNAHGSRALALEPAGADALFIVDWQLERPLRAPTAPHGRAADVGPPRWAAPRGAGR